ncbi:MAG TPA: choice-of-anchor tandem repeat GloVer-containing protein [Terriglobales bacterium]|nr:choice-of-anchor tandem repeat GloVer-containing protein [Terriglobales bacterium]
MNSDRYNTPRKTLVPRFRKIFSGRLVLLVILVTLACQAFGQTLTSLYSFGSAPHDGVFPGSGVAIDAKGNLFGATGVGGRHGSFGTVFELSHPLVPGGQWVENILYRFSGTPDGKNPLGRLVMTSTGSLAGTTLNGGVDGSGIVYTLAPGTQPGTWKKTKLHDFGTVPDDVVTPDLGLFSAPEGFYGVDQGGANGTGAFYLLTPPASGRGAWTQNILYSFLASGSGDAAGPGGEPIRDAAGNFYGVTALGGVNNMGAVYELSPPTVAGGPWTEAVLHSFNGTDGTLPVGPLLLGPGGVLYGTANGGGDSGEGLVFELDPPTTPGDAWTENIVHAFGGDGSSPSNGVITDKRGRLFGTAGGTVFMLTKPRARGGVWTETILHSFSVSDGFIINSPITLFKNALYGVTAQGGTFGTGMAYKLTLP